MENDQKQRKAGIKFWDFFLQFLVAQTDGSQRPCRLVCIINGKTGHNRALAVVQARERRHTNPEDISQCFRPYTTRVLNCTQQGLLFGYQGETIYYLYVTSLLPRLTAILFIGSAQNANFRIYR